MRSSCAPASPLALAALLAVVLSCAPKEPPAPPLEPLVSIEGTVVLAGDDPLERRVVLSDEGGPIAALRGDALELELRALAGIGVRVTGRLAPRAGAEPEFLVDRYELLPIDGATPLVGVIEDRSGAPCLVDARGTSYLLEGPLARALASFAGCKVWVAGTTPPGGEAESRVGAQPRLAVESYGLLLPPAATGRAR